MIELSLTALFGGAWRWCDGRGYGPGAVRLAACFVVAMWICRGAFGLWPHVEILEAMKATLIAAAFAAIWLPRQKQREELDDMLLRWAVPFLALGLLIAFLTGAWQPIAIMGGGGAAIAWLVRMGVLERYWTWRPSWWPAWLDPAAMTEAAAGAIAFTALAFALRLSLAAPTASA